MTVIDRRATPRQRTLIGGRVCFNRGRSTLDCLVRNMSDRGAMIVMSDAVALPIAFEIEVEHRQRSYSAQIRWRDGDRIGLIFETPPPGSAEIVPLDLARRLKHVEQANARLKARIAQLTEPG